MLDEGCHRATPRHRAQVHAVKLDGRVQAMVSEFGDHLPDRNSRGEGEWELCYAGNKMYNVFFPRKRWWDGITLSR